MPSVPLRDRDYSSGPEGCVARKRVTRTPWAENVRKTTKRLSAFRHRCVRPAHCEPREVAAVAEAYLEEAVWLGFRGLEEIKAPSSNHRRRREPVSCALRIKSSVWIWLLLGITGFVQSPVRAQNK